MAISFSNKKSQPQQAAGHFLSLKLEKQPSLSNKKAVFYTATAIILVIILLLAFNVLEAKKDVNRNDVTLARVKTMDNFVKNMDNDLKRAINIACIRATLSLEERIAKQGTYLTNAETAYAEAMMNGTINGTALELMQDSTFPLWVSKIQAEAAKTGIQANFQVHSIQVYQDDPWHVKGKINITINVTDSRNTSSWIEQKEIIASTSIIGLEDPLYALNTYGRVPNVINMTSYEGDYVSGSNVGNLLIHLNNSYYAANTDAPSFLMRFQNNLSTSPFGIESMINLDKLQKQGLSIQSKTAIDYLYWGSASTTNYRVNGTPSWYYIDSGHTAKYQVTGLTY